MNIEPPDTVATNFNCEQCGKIFLNIGDFVTHKQLYQNVRHFYCDLCEIIFDKLKNFNGHFRQCERRKRFTCNQCSETFNHEINLNLHKVLHLEKPWKCPECEKIFPRFASFKCHLIMHRVDETVLCQQCQEEFVYYFELQRHIKTVHNETFSNTTPLYICKQCGAAFKRPLELAEHRITHKKIKDTLHIKKKKRQSTSTKRSEPLKFVKCKICDKQFSKQSSLERHDRIHTGEKPYACKVCNKSFNQKGSLMFHEAKHLSEKPYKCQLCGVGFAQRGNLRTHVRRVHPANAAGRAAYECPLCSCVMRSLQSLNAHLSKRHNDALKFLDADGSSKLDSLAVVQLNAHGRLENPDIFYSFSTQYEPTPTTIELEPTLTGPPAQILHNSETNLTPIVRTLDGLKKKSSPKKCSAATKLKSTEENDGFCGSNIRGVKIRDKHGRNVWLCPYCPRELARSSDLVRHVRVHTGEKPYKCTLCTKSFALRTTRDQHARTHCGIKPMRCYICFKELSTSYTLKAHMRIHRNEAFQCAKCPKKRFRTRAHLNTHWRRSHDGEIGDSALTVLRPSTWDDDDQRPTPSADDVNNRPLIVLEEPFIATDQGFLFQTAAKGSYNDPKTMACTTNDDGSLTFRRFPCQYCPQKFIKANHLHVHERSHTGEKPYQCRTCRRRFVTASSLKDHLKIHAPSRNFTCDRCYKNFKNKRTLGRHMFVHTDQRPFVCPYCRKAFRRGVLCRRHIKTHRRDVELQLLKQIDAQNLHEIQMNAAVSSSYETWTTTNDEIQNNYGTPTATASYVVDQQSSYISVDQQTSYVAVEPISAPIHCPESPTPCLDQFSAEILSPNGLQNLMNELDAVSMGVGSDGADLQQQPSQYITIPSSSCGDVESYVVHNTEGLGQNLIHVCSICFSSFAEVRDYQAHLILHQPMMVADSSATLEPIRKTSANHICTLCSSNFMSEQALNRHMRVIHKQENIIKYACPVCGKTFSRATQVNRHIFHVHRQQKTAPPVDDAVHPEVFRQLDNDWPTPSTSMEIPNVAASHFVGTKRNTKLNMSGQLSLYDLCRTTTDADPHATVTVTTTSFDKPSTTISGRYLSNRRQCPFTNCTKSFKKPSDLARHVRCHTGEKPFPCDECGRLFRVKSTLIAHKKTHVNSTPMHKCQVCHKDFASRGSLKVHFRLHTNERPYSCSICTESFRSSGLLKHHASVHHASPIDHHVQSMVAAAVPHAAVAVDRTQINSHVHAAFTCAETSAFTPVVRHHGTDNRPDLIRNELGNGVGDELIGSTKVALQILQEDNNLRLLVKPGVVEPVDANTVVVEVTFLRELAANGLTLTIPVSFVEGDLAGSDQAQMTTVTVSPTEILAHASAAPDFIQNGSNFVQTTPNFVQPTSNLTDACSNFVAQQASSSTAADHIYIVADDDDTFVVECPICDLKFTNPDESRMHFSSNEHETAALVVSQTNGVKQKLCDRCGKTFPTLARLRRHVATHVDHRPYQCHICGQSFTQKNTLKKHFSARHMGEKPFKCSICAKHFTHKCNLQKHVERLHGNGDDRNLISVDSQWQQSMDSQNEQTFLLRL